MPNRDSTTITLSAAASSVGAAPERAGRDDLRSEPAGFEGAHTGLPGRNALALRTQPRHERAAITWAGLDASDPDEEWL